VCANGIHIEVKNCRAGYSRDQIDGVLPMGWNILWPSMGFRVVPSPVRRHTAVARLREITSQSMMFAYLLVAFEVSVTGSAEYRHHTPQAIAAC
jgi:hypothetical protein